MADNSRAINRVFTRKVISDLVQDGKSVLKEYFGFVPETDPVFHFRVCLEKFEEIPILEAQHLALQEMKKRSKITVEQFGKIRPELKAVVYFSNLEKQTPMLNQLLDTPYRR